MQEASNGRCFHDSGKPILISVWRQRWVEEAPFSAFLKTAKRGHINGMRPANDTVDGPLFIIPQKKQYRAYR